jgi:hypothetical protein
LLKCYTMKTCLWLNVAPRCEVRVAKVQVHAFLTSAIDGCKWSAPSLPLYLGTVGYGLDDRGSRVRFPAGAGNFSLHHRVQNGSGAQWLPGALYQGIKRTGREGHHSPPSSDEVKECVGLYLHSPARLHGVVLS